MKKTISIRLMRTLMAGKSRLSEEALSQIRQYVKSQQERDGVAFMNKTGKPDLYYTAFGWLLSYVLGIDLDAGMRKQYLQHQDSKMLGLIHYAAFMRCCLLDELMDKGKLRIALTGHRMRQLRPMDSFTEVPQHDLDCPYSKFVWMTLLEDTRNVLEHTDSWKNSLDNYKTPNGGYSNFCQQNATSSVNATAAALAVKGQLNGWKPAEEILVLRQMQDETGGFKAVAQAPAADLLSTATALFILGQYGINPLYEATDFIVSHWLDNGGFGATLLDNESDVEYVFYGLLALGA